MNAVNCTDFLFDNEYLSDYGMMICSFDSSDAVWSGGDVSFTTIKLPGSDKLTYYTHTYEQPLSCTFSICKNPAELHDETELVITQEEYSLLSRFLKRTDGYHWLQFDADGFEDIFFNCQINLQPHKIHEKLVGFDVTVNTDSPYAYSRLERKTFLLTPTEDYTLVNYSDTIGNIYPKVTIKILEDGSLKLNSGLTDNLHKTIINNCKKGDIITLDGEYDYFDGIANPNDFIGFTFPVLANSYYDRNTVFSLEDKSVSCELTIEYRLVRMVTI